MLIAFEGTDRKGRSAAAQRLSGGQAIPNLTSSHYRDALNVAENNKGIVQCFDGIGWFSHLVLRLARLRQPDTEASEHSVFTMADTHLVFKLFKAGQSSTPEERDTNQVYTSMAHTFMALNESRDFTLFKTVTIVESYVDPLDGADRLEVKEFSSPLQSPWNMPTSARLVQDDLSLFDMLSIEDASL